NDVTGILDRRVGNVLHTHVGRAVPADSLHDEISRTGPRNAVRTVWPKRLACSVVPHTLAVISDRSCPRLGKPPGIRGHCRRFPVEDIRRATGDGPGRFDE